MSASSSLSKFTLEYLSLYPAPQRSRAILGMKGQAGFTRDVFKAAIINEISPLSVEVALQTKSRLFSEDHVYTCMLTDTALFCGRLGKELRFSLGDIKTIQVLPGLTHIVVNGRAIPIAPHLQQYEEYDITTCQWVNGYFQALIGSFAGRNFPPLQERNQEHGPFYNLIQNYFVNNPPPIKSPPDTETLLEIIDYLGEKTPPIHDILLACKMDNHLWMLSSEAMYFNKTLRVPLFELQSVSFRMSPSDCGYIPVVNGMDYRANANVPDELFFDMGLGPVRTYICNITAYLVSNKQYVMRQAREETIPRCSALAPNAVDFPEQQPQNIAVPPHTPYMPSTAVIPVSLVPVATSISPPQSTPAPACDDNSLYAGSIKAKEENTGSNAILNWGCGSIFWSLVIAFLVSCCSDLPFLNAFGIILLILIGIGIYFIPAIIAFGVRHPMRWPILGINFLLGSTVLGWLAAFIWCFIGRSKR